jgi:hypothetical protein
MGHRLFTVRRLVVLLGAAVVAVAVGGFAASNTVPATGAGDGSGNITGFTISNVHYTLDAIDPTRIAQTTFTLAPAPSPIGTIRIKLVAAGATWYSCTAAGADVTCTTTGASALAADQLRVVVVD